MTARRFIRFGLAAVLCFLVCDCLAQSQQPAASAGLKVVVEEGAAAVNDITARAPRQLAVRIEDQENHPLAGAVVVLQLPMMGAGGSFPDGTKIVTDTADAEGLVKVTYQPNQTPGEIEIKLTVSWQDRSATVTIKQKNAAPVAAKKSGNGKLIAILVIVGGGAAAGAAVALGKGKGSSSTSTPTPTPTPPTPAAVTISIGSGVSVGGP